MTIKSKIKAGGMLSNHNQTLKIRSAVKAGGMLANHNQPAGRGCVPIRARNPDACRVALRAVSEECHA
jgi:hypothetical protein